MQKKHFLFLIVLCIAIILVAGCASTKDMGMVRPPTTVQGAGPAVFNFYATNPSYSFHVTSTGDNAGMIVTITGTKRDSEGKIKSGDIVHDAFAPAGIDVNKRLGGFQSDIYTIEVMTTNDDAPWAVTISATS